MAGPLTWRDVSAPDFRGSQDAFSNFGKMLNGALGQLGSGIKEFDNSRSEQINNEIMTKLMASQDADGLRNNPLATLGIDEGMAARMSGATRSAISSRPTQLLEQNSQFRAEGKVRLQEELSPVMQEMYLARQNNKPEEFARLYEANKANIHKMGANEFLGLMKNLNGVERDNIGLAGSRLGLKSDERSFEQNGTLFARGTKEYEADQTATALSEQLYAEYGGDPDLTESYLNQSDIDPLVRSRVRAKLGLAGRGFGGGGGESSGGAGGIPTGPAGSYENFVVALESNGEAGATNDKSSATGLHQFTTGTWAATVAQANPEWARGMSPAQIQAQRTNAARSTEMELVFRGNNSAALQRAGAGVDNVNLYAMHHFGEGGGLKFARANGNTPMSAILNRDQINANGYLRNLTKNQTISNWNQRAAASSLPQVPLSERMKPSQVNGIEPMFAQSPLVTNYAQTAVDSASDNEVATRLTKGNGEAPARLAGVRHDWLMGKIRDVRAKAAAANHPISAATAGDIVEGAYQPVSLARRILIGDGAKYTIDQDLVDSQLALITTNQLSTSLDNISQTRQAMTNTAASEAATADARSRLRAARRRGVRNLAPFELAVRQAEAVEGAAGNAAEREENLQRTNNTKGQTLEQVATNRATEAKAPPKAAPTRPAPPRQPTPMEAMRARHTRQQVPGRSVSTSIRNVLKEYGW